MKFHIILLIVFVVTNIIQFAATEDRSQEYAALVLHCLQEVIEPTAAHGEILAKVEHFSVWSATEEEEIPCFTRCLVNGTGYYNNAKGEWEKQYIVDTIGSNVYNYCRYELARPRRNACEMAHRGLRCMQQAEEQLQRTHKAILDCIEKEQVPMSELQAYANFKWSDHITYLFMCFAEKMEFYNGSDYSWNYENWQLAFGPMKNDDVNVMLRCKASEEKIASRPPSEWMYEEYACLESLNSQADDGTTSMPLPLATTVRSVLQTKEENEVDETTEHVVGDSETMTNETPTMESGSSV